MPKNWADRASLRSLRCPLVAEEFLAAARNLAGEGHELFGRIFEARRIVGGHEVRLVPSFLRREIMALTDPHNACPAA
jgi:hypothetical protein